MANKTNSIRTWLPETSIYSGERAHNTMHRGVRAIITHCTGILALIDLDCSVQADASWPLQQMIFIHILDDSFTFFPVLCLLLPESLITRMTDQTMVNIASALPVQNVVERSM